MLRPISAGSNRLGKLSLPCHLERMPGAFAGPKPRNSSASREFSAMNPGYNLRVMTFHDA